ncbi:hypothetical protein [Glycocaulis sp.]
MSARIRVVLMAICAVAALNIVMQLAVPDAGEGQPAPGSARISLPLNG